MCPKSFHNSWRLHHPVGTSSFLTDQSVSKRASVLSGLLLSLNSSISTSIRKANEVPVIIQESLAKFGIDGREIESYVLMVEENLGHTPKELFPLC